MGWVGHVGAGPRAVRLDAVGQTLAAVAGLGVVALVAEAGGPGVVAVGHRVAACGWAVAGVLVVGGAGCRRERPRRAEFGWRLCLRLTAVYPAALGAAVAAVARTVLGAAGGVVYCRSASARRRLLVAVRAEWCRLPGLHSNHPSGLAVKWFPLRWFQVAGEETAVYWPGYPVLQYYLGCPGRYASVRYS